MKIVVRVFTMLVVFAGLALASLSSTNANGQIKSSAAFMDPGPLGLPIPECGPGIPGCKTPPPPPARAGGALKAF